MPNLNTYNIFEFNPDYPSKSQVPYRKVDKLDAKTAREALVIFAEKNELPMCDGPAGAGYWLQGQKKLSSWGRSQYHADKTSI